MCRACNDTGHIGSPGYWIYCSCEEGRRVKREDEEGRRR